MTGDRLEQETLEYGNLRPICYKGEFEQLPGGLVCIA